MAVIETVVCRGGTVQVYSLLRGIVCWWHGCAGGRGTLYEVYCPLQGTDYACRLGAEHALVLHEASRGMDYVLHEASHALCSSSYFL